MIHSNKGQAVLMTVMLIGMVLSSVILLSFKRQNDLNLSISNFNSSQTAQEVLSSAAKRVQQIYAAEAGCDPTTLDNRLSGLSNLPTTASNLGFLNATVYASGQPSATTSSDRFNLCTSGTSGCRQFAVPLEGKIYVVTAGYVAADPKTGSYTGSAITCPRDATIRLSVAVNGTVFMRRATLLNICTLKSSTCSTNAADWQTTSPTNYTASAAYGNATITACGNFGAYYYGSFISAGLITVDDIRWARKYLESGRGAIGDTAYALFTSTPSGTNGTCPAGTSSTSQCAWINCVPHFDLNRDRVNNEADLAILELYYRGFITEIPVTKLQ